MSTTAIQESRQSIQGLAELERIIKGTNYVERGLAINEIIERKLYLPDFKTFPQYIHARFGYHRSYAYRLVEAAKEAQKWSPIVDLKREAHVRALLNCPESDREAALRKAIERAKAEQRPLKASDLYAPVSTGSVPAPLPNEDVSKLAQLRQLWADAAPDERAEFLTFIQGEPLHESRIETAELPPATSSSSAGEVQPAQDTHAGETKTTQKAPEPEAVSEPLNQGGGKRQYKAAPAILRINGEELPVSGWNDVPLAIANWLLDRGTTLPETSFVLTDPTGYKRVKKQLRDGRWLGVGENWSRLIGKARRLLSGQSLECVLTLESGETIIITTPVNTKEGQDE